MTIAEEAQFLWKQLELHSSATLHQSLPTRGLGGRSSGKHFTADELKNGRLTLGVEGRDAPPKKPPFIQQKDFEIWLAFERREISREEASKSWTTSYTGPLIDLLRRLPA